MKLIAMLGAGALAAGMLGAVPAEAQRYGYGYDRGSHGYGDRGYHRGFRDHGYRGANRYAYRGGRHGFRGDYGTAARADTAATAVVITGPASCAACARAITAPSAAASASTKFTAGE